MVKHVQSVESVFSAAKLFQHKRIRRYDWKDKGEKVLEIYPITIELGPSGPGNCPHKCNFCMHGSYYNTKAQMPLKLYQKLIDEVTSYDEHERPRSVIFSSSGEPTANPQNSNFIRYTKQKGLEVALITNGWGWINRGGDLTNIVLEDVAWTRTSLDAGTPSTRYKTHGVNDYEDVLKKLGELAQKKKKTGSECNIGAQIVVTEENFTEIIEACKRVKETGIDYIQVKPVIFHPNDQREQLPKEFWKNVLEMASIAERMYDGEGFRVVVKDDQFNAMMNLNCEVGSYKICRATFFPIIEADGTVFYCSQTRGMPEFELGNINQTSFREIWEGRRRREIVGNIDVTKCQPVCRGHFNNKLLQTVSKGGNAPAFV